MSRRKRRPGEYEEGFERYGMESEDWSHYDDYWRSLYGDDYPHDRESYRDYRGHLTCGGAPALFAGLAG